jgi:sentrin-specific protease 1
MMQILYKNIPLSDDWSKEEDQDIPQQKNSYDCGVYCCQFMKFASLGKQVPPWTEHDIPQIRRMMAMEIYEGGLRWFM